MFRIDKSGQNNFLLHFSGYQGDRWKTHLVVESRGTIRRRIPQNHQRERGSKSLGPSYQKIFQEDRKGKGGGGPKVIIMPITLTLTQNHYPDQNHNLNPEL